MDYKIGDKVITLVDKEFTENIDKRILIPKGTIGYVCDDPYKDGVLIEIDIDNVLDPVFGYLFSEIEKF